MPIWVEPRAVASPIPKDARASHHGAVRGPAMPYRASIRVGVAWDRSYPQRHLPGAPSGPGGRQPVRTDSARCGLRAVSADARVAKRPGAPVVAKEIAARSWPADAGSLCRCSSPKARRTTPRTAASAAEVTAGTRTTAGAGTHTAGIRRFSWEMSSEVVRVERRCSVDPSGPGRLSALSLCRAGTTAASREPCWRHTDATSRRRPSASGEATENVDRAVEWPVKGESNTEHGGFGAPT